MAMNAFGAWCHERRLDGQPAGEHLDRVGGKAGSPRASPAPRDCPGPAFLVAVWGNRRLIVVIGILAPRLADGRHEFYESSIDCSVPCVPRWLRSGCFDATSLDCSGVESFFLPCGPGSTCGGRSALRRLGGGAHGRGRKFQEPVVPAQAPSAYWTGMACHVIESGTRRGWATSDCRWLSRRPFSPRLAMAWRSRSSLWARTWLRWWRSWLGYG
jgi:hypothetical protein